jgi:GntR family histidine utilization transcriptional repressor
MTVNKVLSGLADAGLITRRRGIGSVVSRPRVESAVLQIPDLRAEIEERGERYGYELLERKKRLATRDDKARLGLEERVPVLSICCRHTAGGRPFAIEERLLNLQEIPEAQDQDFSLTPPNAWLVSHVPWTEAEHRISACNADKDLASALAVSEGTACLIVERRTWRSAQPITAVRISHPGSVYNLVARFQPTE